MTPKLLGSLTVISSSMNIDFIEFKFGISRKGELMLNQADFDANDLPVRCKAKKCDGFVVLNEETELETCEKCGLIHA